MQLATPEPMPDDEEWLEDWALYAAIKKAHNGRPWFEWPTPLRDRHPQALETTRTQRIHQEHQQCFQAAWSILAEEAKARNITLIGDVPIFIAHDSADVWAHRELFQLDADGMPLHVAGVPPDYFSENGKNGGRCSTIGTLMNIRGGVGGSNEWSECSDSLTWSELTIFAAFIQIGPCQQVTMTHDRARGRTVPRTHFLVCWYRSHPLQTTSLLKIWASFLTRSFNFANGGLPGMAVMQFGFDGVSEKITSPCNIPS